jgi:KH domain
MIDQRFHKALIGQQGAKIKEIRDQFNNVQISFPDASKQSDVVSLRGPKNEVDRCYTYLQKLAQDMVGVKCALEHLTSYV